MRKTFFYIIIATNIIGCNLSNSHELEEDIAIQDITYDFVKSNIIFSANGLENNYEDLDTALKKGFNQDEILIYISDSLKSISKVFKDEMWTSEGIYHTEQLDTLFKSIYNSKTFNSLEFRKLDKSNIKFNSPLKNLQTEDEGLNKNQQYCRLSFSRICFNKERNLGLVIIHFGFGYKKNLMSGWYHPYLIKKENNEWKVIQKSPLNK